MKCITDALNNIKNQNCEDPQKKNLDINNNDDDILQNNSVNNLEKTEFVTETDLDFHGNKEIFYYEVCGKNFII